MIEYRTDLRRHIVTGLALAVTATLAGCAATVIDGAPQRAATPVANSSSAEAPAETTPTVAPSTETSAAPETAMPWPAIPELPTDLNATSDDEPATPDAEVGLRADAPAVDLDVEGLTDEDVDRMAVATLSDLFDFYADELPSQFGIDYTPPSTLISYDASDPEAEGCGESLYDFVNAFYAAYCDTVAWDRGVLLPDLAQEIGPLAPGVILAHEIGHDVQDLLGEPETTPTIVLEQQADCYAGAYYRWVADGNSRYVTFSDTEGMRQMLLTLLALKDPPMMRDEFEGEAGEDNHGSGFDRVYAATLGYSSGVVRCSEIDADEVAERGKEFPFDDLPYQYGNLDMTTENIEGIAGTVDLYFTQTQPGYRTPTLSAYAGTEPPDCAGAATTTPVGYCDVTNTVSYDADELVRIGTPLDGWDSAGGDFSAFILIASRYALAAQLAGFAPITGTEAGLLALCYAGTWANWMRLPRNDYQLSPNDLDKAIYEIISSPLAGSDIRGRTDATIFDRVQAFGYGVTTTITRCFDAYA